MNLQITGQHLEVTAGLRSHVEEKLNLLLRHAVSIQEILVVLHADHRLEHKAEAELRLPKHHVHAEASAKDLYVAIDDMVAKLNRQLIKHKEKNKRIP